MARTVDGDKGPAGRRLSACSAAREQFLARAALPFEQHGGVGAGSPVQLLHGLPQLRILADDPRSTAPLGQLLFDPDVLGKRPALRDRVLHEQRQAVGVYRLGEEVDRAFLHRRDRLLNAAIGGHDDHLQFRIELPGSTQHP